MKEILIDLYKTKNIYAGLGQFSLNFANELINQTSDDIKFIYLIPPNSSFSPQPNIKLLPVNFQKRYLPVLNRNYDIWHSLHQFPSHFPHKKTKQILSIHDLNFLLEKDKSKSQKYLKRLQKNIDRAHYITTISNYTKKIIEENIDLKGKEVRVIYNGINIRPQMDAIKPTFVGNKKFFFSVSIFNRKKNFHVLLPLMKHFKDFQLILAGNHETSYGNEIKAEIDRLNLNERIILPGKISETDKYWLYKNCEAFLFPSLAEGFGMPVIEAMKLGKPVFLSKYTSLPEIGGEMAYYFDSFDEFAMSTIIKENLESYSADIINISKKIKKYANKFDWVKCISEYKQLYIEILNSD